MKYTNTNDGYCVCDVQIPSLMEFSNEKLRIGKLARIAFKVPGDLTTVTYSWAARDTASRKSTAHNIIENAVHAVDENARVTIIHA